MKFRVLRDVTDLENPPIPGAKWEPYTRVDQRSTNDPAKIPWAVERNLGSDWWYQDGRNHRVLANGNIARDFDGETWLLEITTLDELLDIAKKESFTLGECWNNPDMLQLTFED